MRGAQLLQVDPMPPAVIEELQSIGNRLACLRENFNTLANDFGITIDHPPIPEAAESIAGRVGLDGLRTEITQINTQIALIEQLHERLFAARSQLFGFGDGEWKTTTDVDIPGTPGNYGPVRAGDHRTH